MKSINLLLITLIFSSTMAIADGDQLSCEKSWQSNDVETQLFKQAPSGAKRISEHVIELKYVGGAMPFTDKPPYEPLSGTRWRYCGYDQENRIHLVGKSEGDLFSGVIVSETSGKISPAGQTVLISPDKKKFLAVEQQSGVDGENWTFYTIDGKKRWTGYAGITERKAGETSDAVYAEFTNPTWDKNHLTAQVDCSNSVKNEKVTLESTPTGWAWTPRPTCIKENDTQKKMPSTEHDAK